MGNTHLVESKRALMPPNPMLHKNYTCYYHRITSFPEGMEVKKCTVMDHTPNKKMYSLRDDTDPTKHYTMIPHIYLSSYRSGPLSWNDYFKVGTIVKTTCGGLSYDGGPRRAEITAVNRARDGRTTVDLKDLKTGFTVYGVSCAYITFDIGFYKDW
jgi:hypothetical protein